MATIPKGKPIHSSGHLKNAIEYIQNDEKTKNKAYCSGVNVSIDSNLANEQFKSIQKIYDKGNYKNTDKENIIAHHFTQNFRKDENITPELAHAIALETAEKHFGNDFQILISTHVDKEHIHNHFIINSISMSGKKYHSQGDTLTEFRKTSNDICKSYGLKTLDMANHKKRKRTLTYNRWREKQKGVNWKDRIKIDIDKAIIKSNNFDELLKELDKLDYESKFFENAKGEKCFGIRDKKFKKTYFANTKNFGDGYDLKSLEEKINNKDLIELPNKDIIDDVFDIKKAITIKVYKQQNIQVKYKSTITILVDLIMNKNVIKPIKYYKQYPYSVKNDYHVQTLADQLSFINKKGITNFNELEKSKDKLKTSYDDLTIKVNKLVKMKATHKTLVKEFETFEILQNKKELSQDELNLMNTLDKKLEEFDLIKIKNNLILIEENIEKIKPIFKQYGEEMKMFEEIETTLDDIEKEAYIEKAKITYQSQTQSQVETKSENDIERR